MGIYDWDTWMDEGWQQIESGVLDLSGARAYINRLKKHWSMCKAASETSEDQAAIWMLTTEALLEDLKEITLKAYGIDLVTMNPRVHVSYSKDITKDFEFKALDFKDLYRLALSAHNYSPSSFKDGYRDKLHYLGGNDLIVLDIDSGWTLAEAEEYLDEKGLMALLTTTKSHQIDKNGKIADRFRVFLPTTSQFIGTADEYKDHMIEIMKYFGGIPDPACKDSSRFYFGSPNGIHIYTRGESLLSWTDFKKPEGAVQKFHNTQPTNVDNIHKWFADNLQEGQRNQMLYKAFKFYTDQGMSDFEVYTTLQNLNNSSGNPVSDEELKLICRIK